MAGGCRSPNGLTRKEALWLMRGLRAWRGPGLVALAVTCAPLSVAAQSVSSAIAPGERIQDVDVSAETLYDSNVAASQIVGGLRRGIRQSDVIFEPAINFNIARPIGRETVYLQGSAGYDFYARNSILNRENLNIAPGVLAPIGLCQTSVVGNYSRAQSDLSELALTPLRLPRDCRSEECFSGRTGRRIRGLRQILRLGAKRQSVRDVDAEQLSDSALYGCANLLGFGRPCLQATDVRQHFPVRFLFADELSRSRARLPPCSGYRCRPAMRPTPAASPIHGL